MVAKPAVFLDRDGTLVVERNYLGDPAEVELIPGAAVALRDLGQAGLPVILVTNQSGVARGYFPEEVVGLVHARLAELLAAEGAHLDAIYQCPHHPEFGPPCDCRKPAIGMGRRAAEDLGLDLGASWMIGDGMGDIGFGLALGMSTYLVETGHGVKTRRSLPENFAAELERVSVVANLPAAVREILGGRR